MEYNICKTCDSKDGRAGDLVNGECRNCSDTRETGQVIIYSNLPRTEEEQKKTMDILTPKKKPEYIRLECGTVFETGSGNCVGLGWNSPLGS